MPRMTIGNQNAYAPTLVALPSALALAEFADLKAVHDAYDETMQAFRDAEEAYETEKDAPDDHRIAVRLALREGRKAPTFDQILTEEKIELARQKMIQAGNATHRAAVKIEKAVAARGTDLARVTAEKAAEVDADVRDLHVRLREAYDSRDNLVGLAGTYRRKGIEAEAAMPEEVRRRLTAMDVARSRAHARGIPTWVRASDLKLAWQTLEQVVHAYPFEGLIAALDLTDGNEKAA